MKIFICHFDNKGMATGLGTTPEGRIASRSFVCNLLEYTIGQIDKQLQANPSPTEAQAKDMRSKIIENLRSVCTQLELPGFQKEVIETKPDTLVSELSAPSLISIERPTSPEKQARKTPEPSITPPSMFFKRPTLSPSKPNENIPPATTSGRPI